MSKFRLLLPCGLVPLTLLAFATTSFGDTRTWTGGGGNANSGNTSNWQEGSPANNTDYHVIYDPVNLVSPFRTVNSFNTTGFGFLSLSLAGNETYPGFVLMGSTATTLKGDVTVHSGSHNFNVLSTLTVDSTWNIASGAQIAFGSSNPSFNMAPERKITKRGEGTLFFETSQTDIQGVIQLDQGTILAQNQTGMGSATLVLNAGSLVLQRNANSDYGNSVTVSGNVTVTSQRADSGTGVGVRHRLGSLSIGDHTLTADAGSQVSVGTSEIGFAETTLTGNATFSVANNMANVTTLLTLGAVAGDGFGFTKLGAGVLDLEGVNTYTGNTTVTAGSMMVTGSIHGDSLVQVQTGAKIGGTGTILGDLVLDSGALLLWNASDALAVNGTVTLADTFGVDSLHGVDLLSLDDGTYTLISNTSSSFSNISNFGEDNKYDLGDGRFAYFQDGSLQLVIIPEPGFLPLVIIVFAAVLFLRRRK